MSKTPDTARAPSRFAFLLLDNFTLISLSAAVEPLRMANRESGRAHFHWRTLSMDGGPVAASDGLSVNVDAAASSDTALRDVDLLVVCGGVQIQRNLTPPVTRFLHAAKSQGIALGAICTGSEVLAAAGLLDGYRCSIHWQNLARLTDEYPDVIVRRSLFTIDRNRYTSSGGTAPLDMMLHLVDRQLGPQICSAVADQFICERIRHADDEQRIPLRHLVGKQSEKLVTAVELMEANLREPISQEELANYVNLSRRQLQRLFNKYLMCEPSRYYLRLRLLRARDLLLRTSQSILEITAECGFVSTSHFSKSYKAHFGHSPSSERRRAAAS